MHILVETISCIVSTGLIAQRRTFNDVYSVYCNCEWTV